ncbi:T9SS type A sorting domain-containing protein [Chryseobacterium jejuense]|uniref:DUF7619 domain-containing protein n=1 Tax=Chryseobacterium jejuense TaxID=445960 RepID=UPI001AE54570|nr:T9SS type A sorting domain-containing protein [Chryseobacterium jejuense]MBP2615653.1 putative repeat protein (TIGR01451 family) [Chryseobacterium jejuense]
MKKLYLIIFVMIFTVFRAQIVNIPDPNFKAKLLAADVTNSIASTDSGNLNMKIDVNNNGEIEVSEALAVGRLRLYGGDISDLTGIAAFANLAVLDIAGNTLTSLDLSSNIELSDLSIQGIIPLSTLNLTNCSHIRRFSCDNTAITSLDLQNKVDLKYLYISNAPLTNINITGSTNIIELSIENTKLTSFDGSNLSDVFVFYVRNNPLLSSINFANSNIQIIDVSKNNLSTLNIQNQSKLRVVYCENNHLSSLSFPGCPDMRMIYCGYNMLTSFNPSIYPLLSTLNCNNNSIQSLDFSLNSELNTINCNSNNLSFLNLKNGKTQQNNSIGVAFNPNLVICSDDSEFSMIQNLVSSSSYFYSNYQVTTYCSFTPGGNFYTVQGNTKYDSNNNGCDMNDPNKAAQKFTITNGTTSGSIIGNNSGNYSIPLQTGTHSITPVMENPSYFTVNPPSATVAFPAQNSPVAQNFCITANGTHQDLEVIIIPLINASPGFDTKYKIVYKNKGTVPQSGTLAFNYNDSVMDYMNATLPTSSQSSGILNWNFASLQPFETKEIIVTVKLNTPTQTPALNSGDILHYTAQINGATDETPTDNNFTLNQTVVNSFDPNDKTCLEGTSIAKTQVGDYVHYLIRFENTGTANARNIVVKDEIDATKFDISSLVPLNGSHSYVTRVTNPNIIEFIFENIQLPFDDANNDGYIAFKIKTKSTLGVGNSFSNTAKIYFDYNAPIVTNTYTTSIASTLATSEVKNDKNTISIYPNPVKDILHIKSSNEVTKAEIYDTAGRVINSMGIKENTVNVSDLPKGNYLIKLFLKDKVSVQKFIKD